MDGVHQDAGIGGLHLGQQPGGVRQAAQRTVRDEFQHDAKAPCRRFLAEACEIPRQPAPVGVVADGEHVAHPQLRREVEGRPPGHDVGVGEDPEGLDIQDADTRVAHRRADAALERHVANHRDDPVRRERWHDPQPHRIEACRGANLHQRHRISIHDGEMRQGQQAPAHGRGQRRLLVGGHRVVSRSGARAKS
jgi:hypothetical protein